MNMPLLERHLAVLQIKHYLQLLNGAISVGDKIEAQRATDVIDRLATEYGLPALQEAQEAEDE